MGSLTAPATVSALSPEQIRKTLKVLSDDLNWGIFLLVCESPGLTLTHVLYALDMNTKDGSAERQQVGRRLNQLYSRGLIEEEGNGEISYSPSEEGVLALTENLKALVC